MSDKITQTEMLAFTRYLKSYIPGRVRVRHPGLTRKSIADESRRMFMERAGMKGVELNLSTGSALLTYDPSAISLDRLIEYGIDWYRWLQTRL